MSSNGSGDNPYTYRGRYLDQTMQDAPVMGRKRSNSLRRLSRPVLQDLSERNDIVGKSAIRELDVRKGMEGISQEQAFGERIKGYEGANSGDVHALRFASSMAEEAQHEVREDNHQDPTNHKAGNIGMVGIARVGDVRGFGISGKDDDSENAEHRKQVQRRMLVLQKHYELSGETESWSAQLQGVKAPKVSVDDKRDNICAASRATAAALGALGDTPKRVHRSDLPVPDALMELGNRSIGKKGNRMGKYAEVDTGQKGSETTTVMSGRTRSASLGNIMRSCEKCIEERGKHVHK